MKTEQGAEDKKLLSYVIQRRKPHSDLWKTITVRDTILNIRGYENAEKILEELRLKKDEYLYRIIPRNESDKFLEGYRIGYEMGLREAQEENMLDDSGEFDWLPKGMYLPDNL